jgi:DNA replication protein
MLKILYEKGYLNIEKILIKEYKNLNLEISELSILLFLFNEYHQKKIFSSLNFSQKIQISKNELEKILSELMKKNFFSLSQEKKNKKIVEILSLENTFYKLENLFLSEIKKKKEKQKTELIEETINKLEELKKKVLTGFELEIVKKWYLEKKYPHKNIINSIKQAFVYKKTSLYYIEKILNDKNNHVSELEKNDFTDKMLHKIFKKIK